MEKWDGINGTMIGYAMICDREVWLMARHITADQDDDNMTIGRFIHEQHYKRDEKEIALEHGKMDFVRNTNGQIVVSEIKKTSHFLESSRMQLAFYLLTLENHGIEAVGEIHIPEERKVIKVILNEKTKMELDNVICEVSRIINGVKPPVVKKCQYCRKCAYSEMCWS